MLPFAFQLVNKMSVLGPPANHLHEGGVGFYFACLSPPSFSPPSPVVHLRKKEPMQNIFWNGLQNREGTLLHMCGSLLGDLNRKPKKRKGTIREGLMNG